MELGNMVFGHRTNKFPVDRHGAWCGLLECLFEYCYGENSCYPTLFQNDVFEIHPYNYDAECDCGLDQEIDQFSKEHPHKDICLMLFNQKVHDEFKDDGVRNDIMKKEYKRRGIDTSHKDWWHGCLVKCDCGATETLEQFMSGKEHKERCPVALPNFWYHPTDFKLEWYKYPLRDSYCNQNLTTKEFKVIIDHCIDSLTKDKKRAV